MGMRRLLLAMHPRRWRETYGEEFAALLDDTKMTRRAVGDVLRHASRLQARAHVPALVVLGAVVVSAGTDALALHEGLTANILWAPTTPLRALALVGVVAPWANVLGRHLAHGRSRRAT